MFDINKMKLTKKHKGILEKACKRSSPMVVRKQLLSAFGAGDDGYDSEDTVPLWPEEQPVQAQPEINEVMDLVEGMLAEIMSGLNTTNGRVTELEGSIIEMRQQLNDALQHIRELELLQGLGEVIH